MGKKSSLKKIRRIASQMPVIERATVIGERIKGKDLADQGIKEVEGAPIVLNNTYREKKVVSRPINHNRQMKRMYNKHGIDGVNAYIQSVNRFVTAQQQKNKETENNNPDGNEI